MGRGEREVKWRVRVESEEGMDLNLEFPFG